MLAFRARQGTGASALLSAETREAAHLPCLAGEQGSELIGADVVSADELEGCEIGEERGGGDLRHVTCRALNARRRMGPRSRVRRLAPEEKQAIKAGAANGTAHSRRS
jgi:hypothetical protein